MALPRAPRSLTSRALQWLAQREQSRAELRRKLLPYAVAEAAAAADAAEAEAEAAAAEAAAAVVATPSALVPGAAGVVATLDAAPAPAPALAPTERVEALLDGLEAHGYLSAERFIESRVNARSARFGNLRIRHELKQHQLALSPGAAQALRDSELERARALRARKFDQWPADLAGRARQSRFLAGRGFTPEVIARALRESPDDST